MVTKKNKKYLEFLYSSLSLQIYLKKDSGKEVSLGLHNFSEQLFHRTQAKDSCHSYTVLTSFKVTRVVDLKLAFME